MPGGLAPHLRAAGSATTKHWIRVATALNLGLPVAALLDAVCAPHVSWARPLRTIGSLADAAFGNLEVATVVWAGVWSLGALLMLARLWLRLRTERDALRAAPSQQSFVFRGVRCASRNRRRPRR